MTNYVAKARNNVKYPLEVNMDSERGVFKGVLVDFPMVEIAFCNSLKSLLNEAHDKLQEYLSQLDMSGAITPKPSKVKGDLVAIEVGTLNNSDILKVNHDSSVYTDIEISKGKIHLFSNYRDSDVVEGNYISIALKDWEDVKQFVEKSICQAIGSEKSLLGESNE